MVNVIYLGCGGKVARRMLKIKIVEWALASTDRATLCGLRNRTISAGILPHKRNRTPNCGSKLIRRYLSRRSDRIALLQFFTMDFFFSLMVSPAAFAALVAALYWMYPIALLHGYKR